MKHTVQSLVRAALLLGLCLAMLAGCTVVRQTVTTTTSTSSTATSTLTTPPSETLTAEELAELLLSGAEAAEGTKSSVTDWILSWGFDGFWDDKLLAVEQVYDYYYVGDIPDHLTVARTLVSLFCEYLLADTDLSDVDDVTDAFITCYLEAVGDKYAYYMDRESYASYSSDVSGVYEGIGVSAVFDSTLGGIEVVSVFEGSPAEEAGLLVGDVIVAVEGNTVRELGYYEAIDRIRGEAGTYVRITVSRGGEELDFTCQRRQVTEETVVWRMQTDRIGYVRISTFSEVTAAQFKTAVDQLVSLGAESLVFDLRSNSGGLLSSILEILDYLLADGYPLANYFYYDGSTDADLGGDGHSVDLPFAVLCNAYTASAAELFTSALKDYDEKGLADATVVGTRTYGKGMMQTLIAFVDDTAMTVSIAYYQPPYSPNYEGVGVLPHHTVHLAEGLENVNVGKLTPEEDTQLAKAVELLEETDGR